MFDEAFDGRSRSSAHGREGRHEALDIVFMVVEMNREPQVAVPRGADDSLLGQAAEKRRWFGVAERDADDRALVLFGQVKRVPADAGERGPEPRPRGWW